MVRFALDAVTGFSTAPLRMASHVGMWLVVASVLLLVYIAIGFLTGTAIQGWTSLMLVVVVLGAVQMFVLGMIGEYLGRLYVEAKKRPLYIVSDIAGHAGGRPALGHVAQAPVRSLEPPRPAPTRSPQAKRPESSAAGRSHGAQGRKSSRTDS
jgi:hypothetical protein